jgi:hypothetical protein
MGDKMVRVLLNRRHDEQKVDKTKRIVFRDVLSSAFEFLTVSTILPASSKGAMTT